MERVAEKGLEMSVIMHFETLTSLKIRIYRTILLALLMDVKNGFLFLLMNTNFKFLETVLRKHLESE